MTMKHYTIIAFAALVMGSAAAQAQAVIVRTDGTRIRGQRITANQQGDLQIVIGDGAQTTFRRGTYQKVSTPKPSAVENLEQAYVRERYDLIVQNGPQIYNDFRFLGWGGHIGYLLGQAQLRQGNAARALQTFEQSMRYAELQMNEDAQRAQLNKGRVAALLELERNAEAETILTQLKGADAADVAAFAFVASARLHKARGNNREAVLEYMKTVLLFEPGRVPEERNQAKQELVALLRDMNDPRHRMIEEMD